MGYIPGEVIHAGPFTRVLGAQHPESGEFVALKLPRESAPSPLMLNKLRHEHAMLSEAQAPGVVRVRELVPFGAGQALVMERWGVGSLDRALDQAALPVETALCLGGALARALGHVHRRGIIHRDVKPRNVLVNAERNDVRLIDFGIAVRQRVYVAETTDSEALAGTLAYMAPEQTGRMNRGGDARADLYGLGATLYQMLTGVLPFELSDVRELIHAQIARMPIAPHERAPKQGIPEVVSALVLKLMAKNPEHRYQTAEGVAFDLERAARAWADSGAVQPFELGTHDWEDHIRKPSRLHGRDLEMAALERSFAQVRQGAVEMVLVAGPSGVGKSALVGALREQVRDRKGCFSSAGMRHALIW